MIGACGAGKSAFARELGQATGLPVIHLDAEYWLPGWREPDKAEWRVLHARLLDRPEWIMDGNYFAVLAERLDSADTVIWLDYSRWLCRLGAVRRLVGWHGRVRPDVAPECPERLDLEYLRYVWSFHRVYRPRLQELTSSLRPDQRLVVFKRRADAGEFLAGLKPT